MTEKSEGSNQDKFKWVAVEKNPETNRVTKWKQEKITSPEDPENHPPSIDEVKPVGAEETLTDKPQPANKYQNSLGISEETMKKMAKDFEANGRRSRWGYPDDADD